jgi:DnaJ like chaperone protein
LFKIILALLGYYLFGIFGAFLGYLAGSVIDRYRAYGAGAINPLTSARRQAVFLETVFILMGKLAKADGRISEDEVAHVEAFVEKLGMSPEHRQLAIGLFKQGAGPDYDVSPKLNEFISACGHTNSLKQMLLVYLVVMAISDGRLDAAEENLLRGVALHLGYDEPAFEHLLEMILNQSHFAGCHAPPTDALEDAYKALGVSKESSDQEVKRAYRKLMNQYHPDKLMGQGVPEDMIKMATAQAQEIQAAYELIKKSRNMS